MHGKNKPSGQEESRERLVLLATVLNHFTLSACDNSSVSAGMKGALDLLVEDSGELSAILKHFLKSGCRKWLQEVILTAVIFITVYLLYKCILTFLPVQSLSLAVFHLCYLKRLT